MLNRNSQEMGQIPSPQADSLIMPQSQTPPDFWYTPRSKGHSTPFIPNEWMMPQSVYNNDPNHGPYSP